MVKHTHVNHWHNDLMATCYLPPHGSSSWIFFCFHVWWSSLLEVSAHMEPYTSERLQRTSKALFMMTQIVIKCDTCLTRFFTKPTKRRTMRKYSTPTYSAVTIRNDKQAIFLCVLCVVTIHTQWQTYELLTHFRRHCRPNKTAILPVHQILILDLIVYSTGSRTIFISWSNEKLNISLYSTQYWNELKQVLTFHEAHLLRSKNKNAHTSTTASQPKTIASGQTQPTPTTISRLLPQQPNTTADFRSHEAIRSETNMADVRLKKNVYVIFIWNVTCDSRSQQFVVLSVPWFFRLGILFS
jgi:hypothetical protein